VNSPIGNFAVAAKVRSEGPHRGMTEGSSMSVKGRKRTSSPSELNDRWAGLSGLSVRWRQPA